MSRNCFPFYHFPSIIKSLSSVGFEVETNGFFVWSLVGKTLTSGITCYM